MCSKDSDVLSSRCSHGRYHGHTDLSNVKSLLPFHGSGIKNVNSSHFAVNYFLCYQLKQLYSSKTHRKASASHHVVSANGKTSLVICLRLANYLRISTHTYLKLGWQKQENFCHLTFKRKDLLKAMINHK